jgi:hypothetical protein
MKKIFILLVLFLLPFILNAQTFEEIQREANPEYTYVQDNSEFAQLLRDMTAARKSGNTELFNSLLNELNTKYANHPNVKITPPMPENRDVFIPVQVSEKMREINSLPDWANGENRIFGRSVGTTSPGNPNAYNRMIRLETDTIGNLFAGFLNGNKDTLFFYRSTNRGVSWTLINALYAGSTSYYYSFDFALTDTTGGFKIGMVVSIAPNATPYAGTIYYADMLTNGTGFSPTTVDVPVSGRGHIGPVICTDGYSWSPGSTYWYIAYSNCDASTGATTFVPVAYTPNWGSTWVRDTARSTYNDYELDIDYNHNADTIYVLLTNNLTTSNENLRIRYVALGNWGTNVAWSQFNPASTAAPEFNGSMAVNRKTNAMVVTYTATESSNNNILYSYTPAGIMNQWVVGNVLSNQANEETRSHIQSNPQQSGSFRVALVSSSTSFDTVVYFNTFNVTGGFTSRTIVSRVNASSGLIAPALTGYMWNGVTAGAGVIYAGFGPTNVWFNGSDITTETKNITTTVPDKFELSQNYPNPFNPSTKISFAIPQNNRVVIKIYNTLGKEVSEIVNDNFNAGSYEVTFDASNLTSGVYFYKITAGNFTDTKKMLYIK